MSHSRKLPSLLVSLLFIGTGAQAAIDAKA